jgi:DNA-binding transcriptional ArsR family regulator
MEILKAVAVLASLAQETRLSAFRALVAAGENGLPAGEIAGQLGVAPNTLSFHLKELAHAGIVSSRNEGRYVIYRANFDAMRGLIRFLSEECCEGHPELCFPRTSENSHCEPEPKYRNQAR